MSNAAQEVAQIRAAMGARLCPLINTAPGRHLEDSQQTALKLSKALAAYAVASTCDVGAAVAVGALTDGCDDWGIDAVHFDRRKQRLILVQSKFSQNAQAPSQADVLKTINGYRKLRNREFDDFNRIFESHFETIEDALDSPGVAVTIVVIHLGSELGRHAVSDLEQLRASENQPTESVEWVDFMRSRILDSIKKDEGLDEATVQLTVDNWGKVQEPHVAYYGMVSVNELVNAYSVHGAALLDRNIRHHIGMRSRVNKQIKLTAADTPRDLFYLNNGITFVAAKINKSIGNGRKCNLSLEAASIVNGAQTIGTLFELSKESQGIIGGSLLVTMIELGEAADDLGVRITRARNSQNFVMGVDFAALDPLQEQLRRSLASSGRRYYYRDSYEARSASGNSFSIEQAALAMACLKFLPSNTANAESRAQRGLPNTNGVYYAVAAKKDASRLLNQQDTIYSHIFPESTNALQMYRQVMIYRMIDGILSGSELSENSYRRKTFFRHGRQFIACFVGSQCVNAVQEADYCISESDRTLISLQTNIVSETVYKASNNLHFDKGFLAIFRNMTDSQPLADEVLRLLISNSIKSGESALRTSKEGFLDVE